MENLHISSEETDEYDGHNYYLYNDDNNDDDEITLENETTNQPLIKRKEMIGKLKLRRNFNDTFHSGLAAVIDYFPKYELISTPGAIVNPDQRMPWGPTTATSFQHLLAMFGSNALCPLLMGMSPSTSIFFSGIGTLIFYICTGGRLPSYLGSSFAFIGVVNSATNYHYVPGGPGNEHIGVAAGGILVCGLIYLAISLLVIFAGYRWLEILMPPVVTGSVVIAIGLHLAGSAVSQAATTGFDAWMAMLTLISVCLVTMYAPGPFKRLPILIGGLIGYFVYLFCGIGGVGPGIDFQIVRDAKWIGAPPTHTPVFESSAISLIAPVAIILAAENIGHIKAVGAMTGKGGQGDSSSLDSLIGRAFLGDSLATVIAASFGGVGTTTYAENIGVMSITKIFSTLNFLLAACISIILGVLPIFGAVIQTIPPGVFGGLSIILFGIVGITGAKLWINAKVDFSKPRNLLTAGICIVLGGGMVDVYVEWGTVKIDGIGVATFSAIILYQLLRENWGEIFKMAYSRIRYGKPYEKSIDDFGEPTDDGSVEKDQHAIEIPTVSENNNTTTPVTTTTNFSTTPITFM
ncbi:hypothetical protein CYY_003351 [Polysphondylium violaceum]|uniref:Xanthine/uracil permease family protein n=1 Tax=Polysphondylium violaceum TaxID=133409 RepID=A0A8J4PWY5_9MYCE|nr:hypothetical protein CYY_003351 [Polysphondylium violaceum]